MAFTACWGMRVEKIPMLSLSRAFSGHLKERSGVGLPFFVSSVSFRTWEVVRGFVVWAFRCSALQFCGGSNAENRVERQ